MCSNCKEIKLWGWGLGTRTVIAHIFLLIKIAFVKIIGFLLASVAGHHGTIELGVHTYGSYSAERDFAWTRR